MILNHLIATNQLNVVRLGNLIDHYSSTSVSIHKVIHIHVFHSDDMFSKFVFKNGKYDNMTVNEAEAAVVKFYSLKMALEGKKMDDTQLMRDFNAQKLRKSMLKFLLIIYLKIMNSKFLYF